MPSIDLSDGPFDYGLSNAKPPRSRLRAELTAWAVATVAGIVCFVAGFGGATPVLLVAMAVAVVAAIVAIILSEP